MSYYTAPKITRIPFGAVFIPASKSITNRALVLALLANNNEINISKISNFNSSRDTELMLKGIESFGAKITRFDNSIEIKAPKIFTGGTINVGLSGTVLRFLLPITLLSNHTFNFLGDEEMNLRPLNSLIQTLTNLGSYFDTEQLPFSISTKNSVNAKNIEIDSSESSQFISGLIFLASRLNQKITITNISGDIPSKPFVQLTVNMLKNQGAKIEETENTWEINSNILEPIDIELEPDLSNAAVFCSAAVLTGGMVKIKNWPLNTHQPGDKFRSILHKFGILTELNPTNNKVGDFKVFPNQGYSGIEIDLKDCAELTPTITALALFANSPSKICNIGHIKGHETNRIKALVKEINNLNGNCITDGENLFIYPTKLNPGIWKTYKDHRMATTGALVGLKVPDLIVENIETVSKTFPTFLKIWKDYLKI